MSKKNLLVLGALATDLSTLRMKINNHQFLSSLCIIIMQPCTIVGDIKASLQREPKKDSDIILLLQD